MTSSLFKAMTPNINNMMSNQLMDAIRKTNPQAYSILNQIMSSGNINSNIQKYASQLNPQQTAQFKALASQFGLNQADIEKVIRNT